MQVNSAQNTAPLANTGLSGASGDMFLKLLTTQLKEQDPLSPMDPTSFVGQLVQFNTLGEIMTIRELLQSGAAQVSTAQQIASSNNPSDLHGGN